MKEKRRLKALQSLGNVLIWNPSSFAEEACLSPNSHGWTAEESHPGTAFRQVLCALFFPGLEDELHNRGETNRWTEEVEMATSADDLNTSQSIFGYQFSNFEMLDAKIASSPKKIIPNSNFKERFFLEEQKAQLDCRYLRGKCIAFMIYEYFLVTGTHEATLGCSDLFGIFTWR